MAASRSDSGPGLAQGMHNSEQQIRMIWSTLYGEIRKDLGFFGAIGLVVGYFFPLHEKLEAAGLAAGKAWADALTEDFLSINAYALVLFGLILIGSLASALSGFWREFPRLNAMRAHVENRLTQIASSIICFVVGVCALATLHALFTIEPGGLLLLPVSLLLILLIVGSYIAAVWVARRLEPFANRWAAAALASGVVIVMGWLLTQGHP
jgi:hypothetical protein